MVYIQFKYGIQFCLFVFFLIIGGRGYAQILPVYSGKTLSNPDYHSGQLSPVLGVHNIQVMRANRQHPNLSDSLGWTYNHAPMLAWWNDQFYLEYLSNPVGENLAPGATLLCTSKDGIHWSFPKVVFPPYKIPDGTMKPGITNPSQNLYAVYHQRMGFYRSKANRLLILAYVGISMNAHDGPNDGNGIGRVVRELYADGSWGPVYFIHYNHRWNANNTSWPFYTTSEDSGFVKACDELLNNRLMVQQWNEESDRDDSLISVKGSFKAFNYYHLPNGTVIGWWKHALTAVSKDEGLHWTHPVRAAGFVNNNAKIWGQRMTDGNYVTVYNPSDFRWPLALSVSPDGMNFKNLLLVNGQISSMRYGGNYKSYGPQYVRGIAEGNGIPSDSDLWVTYSMNKEDIWVADVPVPVRYKEQNFVDDIFSEMPQGHELRFWNYYSPAWARVTIEKDSLGNLALVLHDADSYDYAQASRVFREAKNISVDLEITPDQNKYGHLDIELADTSGNAAMRLSFTADGSLQQKNGYRQKTIMHYEAGEKYHIHLEVNAKDRFFHVKINNQTKSVGMCFHPVNEFSQIIFRTGSVRRFPTVDTPTDQSFDLYGSGERVEEAKFFIYSLKIRPVEQ